MRNPLLFSSPLSESPDQIEPSAVARAVEAAIHLLLDSLTAIDCQTVLARLQAQRPADPAPRGGEVLGAVIHVLERERAQRAEWSVAEIKGAVTTEGVTATDKQFYNAIGYLARKGRIQQIGYGRYRLVDYGVVIETADELT